MRHSRILLVILIVLLALGLLVARLIRPMPRTTMMPQRTNFRVDINQADAHMLTLLPGIGPGLAQRIVDHRATHGPFTSVEALARVNGIGPKTLDRVRDLVHCGNARDWQVAADDRRVTTTDAAGTRP